MNKIDGIGMIHGRFQPFTIGHMQYLKRALDMVPKGNKLFIGITKPFATDNGMSAGDDHRDDKSSNPYTFEQRREMVFSSIRLDPSIADRIDDIIVIPWSMNNMEDLDKIIVFFMQDKKVTQFMNIIPGDGWEYEKKKILEDRGFTTINLVNLQRPRITSATEVRAKYLQKSPDWTELVPEGTKQILLQLEKNPNAIPNQYTSIDEFLLKYQDLSAEDCLTNVLKNLYR